VEDSTDVQFFEATARILQRQQPLLDVSAPLPPTPTIVFIQASLGRQSGGKSQVLKWVRLIENTSILGIVDMDENKQTEDRIHTISRYEHENYLFDPVVVYAALANVRQAPVIPGVPSTEITEVANLRKHLSPDIFQKIVDYVLSYIEPIPVEKLPDRTSVEVPIVDGPTVRYPAWFLFSKGKYLIGPLQKAFGKSLQRSALINSYERIGWVPSDLCHLLRAIQCA
jgi:hypothetical protein